MAHSQLGSVSLRSGTDKQFVKSQVNRWGGVPGNGLSCDYRRVLRTTVSANKGAPRRNAKTKYVKLTAEVKAHSLATTGGQHSVQGPTRGVEFSQLASKANPGEPRDGSYRSREIWADGVILQDSCAGGMRPPDAGGSFKSRGGRSIKLTPKPKLIKNKSKAM